MADLGQWDLQDRPPEAAAGNAKARDLLAQYWAKFYVVNNACGLCVNTGYLLMVNGERRPCICPGGRTIAENMDRRR